MENMRNEFQQMPHHVASGRVKVRRVEGEGTDLDRGFITTVAWCCPFMRSSGFDQNVRNGREHHEEIMDNRRFVAMFAFLYHYDSKLEG